MAIELEPSAPAKRGSAGFGLGAICLVVSLIVHAVFAPLPSFSALLKPRPRATAAVTRAAFSEVPVDLGIEPAAEEHAAALAEDVEPPASPSPVAADHGPATEPAIDSVAKPRAQRPQRGPSQSSTGAMSRPAGAGLDVGLRASSNSSHLLGRALVSDCSVSALIDIGRVRTHPLAAQLNALLVEWQPLFAEPGFDPLSDVDRLLVVGPELRESGRGLAVVQHHLNGVQVQTALARAGARAPVPGQEHFYLQLSPEVLLISPDPSSVRPLKDFALASANEGTIGTVYVDTPSRALSSLPLEVPASIHWLRGIIQPTGDNGIAVDIEAGDENGELAKAHARKLTRSVLALKTKRHARLIERVLFEARESVIVGRLELTAPQLGALFELLSAVVKAPPEPSPAPEPPVSASDEAEPEQALTKQVTTELRDTHAIDAGVSQQDAAAAAQPTAAAQPIVATQIVAAQLDGGS